MKLWIDADAAPRGSEGYLLSCIRSTEARNDPRLESATAAPSWVSYVTAVRVDGGPDVADMYIAEHAEVGDVAVTQDIPLAALLVPKNVVVIDPRGDEYTAGN